MCFYWIHLAFTDFTIPCIRFSQFSHFNFTSTLLQWVVYNSTGHVKLPDVGNTSTRSHWKVGW